MDTDDVGELCETLLKKFRPKGMMADGYHLYWKGGQRQNVFTLAPDINTVAWFCMCTNYPRNWVSYTTIFGARFESFDMFLDLSDRDHTEIIEQAITNVRKVKE